MRNSDDCRQACLAAAIGSIKCARQLLIGFMLLQGIARQRQAIVNGLRESVSYAYVAPALCVEHDIVNDTLCIAATRHVDKSCMPFAYGQDLVA